MALGISDLVNNIIGSVQSLGASLGILSNKNTKLHPDFPGLLSVITQSNWHKNPPYSFAVVDPFGPTGFGDFELPLAPTDLNQDENFAISIRPTQGGTVTNHGGNRYKDLVLKGTTGIAPFRGAGGVERSTGKAIFQPEGLKYRSGHEVFLTLRNWFKAYYQWKSDEPTAKDAQLIFRNFKDGEFLVVELLKFQLNRSANRKFLYDYTLTFKVLAHQQFKPKSTSFLEDLDNFIDEAKDKIDLARGIFMRSQDILRQIEGTYENTVLEPLRKTSLAVKAFRGIAPVAADMGKKASQNTVAEVHSLDVLLNISKSKILSPANADLIHKSVARASNNTRAAISGGNNAQLVTALFDKSDILMQVDAAVMPASAQAALQQELKAASVLPRSFFQDALQDLVRVRDNAVDRFNLNSPRYDSFVGRVATFTPDPNTLPTDDEVAVLNAFSLAIKGLEKILASNSLFSSSYPERIQNLNDAFGDTLPLRAEQAVREVIMPVGVDLERLALKYLGDSERWPEIAEVNNLKAPYVVQNLSDPTPDVVHPGDRILIPSPLVNGFGTTPQGRPTYFNQNLSEIEKNLGVDLKLSPTFDLQLNNQGNLELAVGSANAAQAIILKLMYEQGDLIKHPEIGVGLEPGSKFPSISDIKMSLIRTLTQDPRFESVDNIAIRREGSTLMLSFVVKVKNVDIPIPISVKL